MSKPKSKKEVAAEYIESLLAHVPAESRDTVKAALTQDAVLDDLGEKTMMRADYSRAMDEAREVAKQAEYDKSRYTQTYEKNLKWYSDNRTALEQYEALTKRGVDVQKLIAGDSAGDSGGTHSAADLSEYVKKADVAALAEAKAQQIIQNQAGQFLNFTTTLNDLSARHLHDYREPLNTAALVETARKQNRPLTDVYRDMTADLAEARGKEIEKKKAADLDAEINRRVNEALSQRSPYPIGGDSEPSTLAGLATKEGIGVEAATRAWLQSQTK